jgi:hypothetical protein
MELRYIIGIAVAIIGYGTIASIILYAHNWDKKQRKIIFDNIRARGYLKYDGKTGKWTKVKGSR